MLVEQVAALLIEIGAVVRPVEVGRKTKVTDPNVTVVVEQKVVGLDL